MSENRNLEARIIRVLDESTGPLKAREIAEILHVGKDEVNHYLYSSLGNLVVRGEGWRWSLIPSIQNLESKIFQTIQQSAHPLKAREVGERLGLPRNIVNHYLFTTLKTRVQQDNEWRWTTVVQPLSTASKLHSPKSKPSATSTPTRQPAPYSHSYSTARRKPPAPASSTSPPTPPRAERPQEKPSVSPTSSKPAAANSQAKIQQKDPYGTILRQLESRSPEEKVAILEQAFAQERFLELNNEEMGALASILETAKVLVEASRTEQQRKLAYQRQRFVTGISVAIAFILGGLLLFTQFSRHQPEPLNSAPELPVGQ